MKSEPTEIYVALIGRVVAMQEGVCLVEWGEHTPPGIKTLLHKDEFTPLATIRKEAATEAALSMRERMLQVVKDLWQETIELKEKSAPHKGYEQAEYEHWQGRLIARSIIEERLTVLPVEGVSERQEERDTLLQECREVLTWAIAHMKPVQAVEYDKARALIARLPEAKEEEA